VAFLYAQTWKALKAMAFGGTKHRPKSRKGSVMENNENFVEQTENVEQTTEQTVEAPVKMFTQEEMNAAVGKAKARERAKAEKQYQREYGELVDVLETATGKRNVAELTDVFRQHYEQRGVKFDKKPDYSAKDIAVLAKEDAAEFIDAGYEDVVEEVDRLANVGMDKLSARERAMFNVLAEYRIKAEQEKELSSIGAIEEEYNSQEFKNFAKMFDRSTPIKDIYDIYRKTKPQKEIKTMGSMKNTHSDDNGVKDFYTVEEARRFTRADYDKNPALFAAVQKSMQKW
jgi:hypothetical protein